jgi:hypothetical protein
MRHLDLLGLGGIVTFQSFHATSALAAVAPVPAMAAL